MRDSAQRAFTLVELLVVTALLGILTGLTLPVLSRAGASARKAQEVAAARQVAAAYLAAAAEQNGVLLPGYTNQPATDDQGKSIRFPANARYPWRLAPYLNYELGVLYGKVGDQRLRKDRSRNEAEWQYSVSVSPAFGMNTIFVGGDSSSFPPENAGLKAFYGDFCATRLAQTPQASRLIAFVSACYGDGEERVPGYFRVDPPQVTGSRWSSEYARGATYAAYGHVDFRHNDKAVAAMLDGHIELLGFDELRDMRRWSRQAQEFDDPDYYLGKAAFTQLPTSTP